MIFPIFNLTLILISIFLSTRIFFRFVRLNDKLNRNIDQTQDKQTEIHNSLEKLTEAVKELRASAAPILPTVHDVIEEVQRTELAKQNVDDRILNKEYVKHPVSECQLITLLDKNDLPYSVLVPTDVAVAAKEIFKINNYEKPLEAEKFDEFMKANNVAIHSIDLDGFENKVKEIVENMQPENINIPHSTLLENGNIDESMRVVRFRIGKKEIMKIANSDELYRSYVTKFGWMAVLPTQRQFYSWYNKATADFGKLEDVNEEDSQAGQSLIN